MHRGYLALWRKLSDHPFWKEKREFSKAEAWIDLLWEVQHKEEPQEVLLGMTCLVCNYGESLKSLETWSKRWGWNKSRVRRFLGLLEKMNQIRHISEKKTTRITVLNYKGYDPKRNASETQVKRQRNTSETTATPDKNVKNEKNKKKNGVKVERPDFIPSSLWTALLDNRKFKKLQNTELALKTFCNAIEIGIEKGYTAEQCIGEFVSSSWKRFNADWMNGKAKSKHDDWDQPTTTGGVG